MCRSEGGRKEESSPHSPYLLAWPCWDCDLSCREKSKGCLPATPHCNQVIGPGSGRKWGKPWLRSSPRPCRLHTIQSKGLGAQAGSSHAKEYTNLLLCREQGAAEEEPWVLTCYRVCSRCGAAPRCLFSWLISRLQSGLWVFCSIQTISH